MKHLLPQDNLQMPSVKHRISLLVKQVPDASDSILRGVSIFYIGYPRHSCGAQLILDGTALEGEENGSHRL